ncbi:hypothetical protein KSP40_PGU008401 [Platanthera guangdongensis]|uniref:RNase H type-1 domain-containing protein n=1 Tax=Platanthera guangdongensis TaxID=2320717 RepID=A0ABR2M199_9ASPA
MARGGLVPSSPPRRVQHGGSAAGGSWRTDAGDGGSAGRAGSSLVASKGGRVAGWNAVGMGNPVQAIVPFVAGDAPGQDESWASMVDADELVRFEAGMPTLDVNANDGLMAPEEGPSSWGDGGGAGLGHAVKSYKKWHLPAGPAIYFDPLVPPPGWIKNNLDGAVRSNRLAGLGMVLWDADGLVLLAAGQATLQWDPGGTELAALKALRNFLHAATFAASGVIIEGDNNNLIDYCRRSLSNGVASWEARDVMGPEFLGEFAHVSFQHVRRTANSDADFCSKFAISSSFCWTDPLTFHPDFLELVQEDLAGIPC